MPSGVPTRVQSIPKSVALDLWFDAGEAFETYHRSTGRARSDAAFAFGTAVHVHDAEKIRALLYAESSFENYDRRGTIRALITACTVVSSKQD